MLEWFRRHEKQFRIKALADVRTQIIERARYRLPDVMVFSTPAPARRLVTQVPDAVIEIVSPDDAQDASLARFRDCGHIGVPHIIQMHPETYIAWRFDSEFLIRTEFLTFGLSDNRCVPFDSEWISGQLRREIAEFEGTV